MSRSAHPFLFPSRTALEAARAATAGLSDARSAWEALAERGLIPAAWLDEANRRFLHDPGDRHRRELPTRDPAFAPTGPHPNVVEHCALFASDVEGMLAAESAAVALAARLEPWGAPACHRVVWWAIPREHYSSASCDTRPGVSYALLFAFNALYRSVTATDDLPVTLFGFARRWSDVWRARAAAQAHIPADVGPPVPALRGRKFAELDNPFEPLADLEATGYATLEYVVATGASRGSLVLVAPT